MTVLERAAEAAKRELNVRETLLASLDHLDTLQARRIARAVLMAVRNGTTEGVRVKGAESVLRNEGRCAYIQADDAFNAMIDAILSEPQS